MAIGLAWTPLGGKIMFVEASRMDGEGQLTLTGQLGDVMKESAHLAISWLRSNAKKYHLTNGTWPNCMGTQLGRRALDHDPGRTSHGDKDTTIQESPGLGLRSPAETRDYVRSAGWVPELDTKAKL